MIVAALDCPMNDPLWIMACYDDVAPLTADGVLLQTLVITVVVTFGFLLSKTTYDNYRKRSSKATLVVVGAGPIGLTSLIIAAKSGKISRAILFEEKCSQDLVNRPQQIALEHKNVIFLQSLGVDFDNIEGCWQQHRFFTRIGVFQEYLLSLISRLPVPVDVRLRQKFSRDQLAELDRISGRVLALACDGSHGRAASLLGLSDEFIQHSCRAYGSVAALSRQEERFVPLPEVRVHNLTFDMNAYGGTDCFDPNPQGFHLKIFGSLRHRYISLAVPKCESRLVRTLKTSLDQTVMRNIIQACYNTYKPESERLLSDAEATRCLKFSPRLFEVKLSQRMESVAFVQDANLFVLTEGEATRSLNFHSGMDINLSLCGLYSLEHFIRLAVPADAEKSIVRALTYKFNHVKALTHEFLKSGMKETMYT